MSGVGVILLAVDLHPSEDQIQYKVELLIFQNNSCAVVTNICDSLGFSYRFIKCIKHVFKFDSNTVLSTFLIIYSLKINVPNKD